MTESKPLIMADTWPIQDHKKVIATIKMIIEHAEEFDAFEADFLTETLRCATRFRDKFRLSPKQVDMLALLEARFALGKLIKAKTTKDPDQIAADPEHNHAES